MTASKIFFYFCFSFIGGIFISSFFSFSALTLLGILILALLLTSVFWKYKKFAVFGFCLLFLTIGIWRYQLAELKITNSQLRNYNDSGEDITLIAKVVEEPDVRENSIKLTIKPEEIDEKILVSASRYPEYQYGDKLKISGRLKTPQQFEEGEEDKFSSAARDFNYRDYLAKDGIYSVMNFPEIELIEKGKGNFVYAKILNFKNKLRETIYQNLSPSQSLILAALILGDKKKISEDLKQKLNIAGVRHITAISGMHIMIFSGILMYLGTVLGLYRGQAFYFAVILLLLFIIMIGAPASAVRAGIMAGLFLLGQKLGRLSLSSRAIVMAAAAMLLVNPLLLKLDVGFQLSFLAIMGIIYFLPTFQSWLRKVSNFFQLRNLLSLTFSAQIFTLPILIYNFGYFSLVSPITNILIVPFLPYIMLSGFIFGLSGIIFQPLGFVLSFPVWFLLTYLIKIVDWFSSFPFASLTLEISWFWLVIFYLILALIAWRLQKKQKLKFLNY